MLNLRINNRDTSQQILGIFSGGFGHPILGYQGGRQKLSAMKEVLLHSHMCIIYIYIYIYSTYTRIYIYIYTDMHIDNHRYTIYAYVAMKINPLTYTSLPGDTPSTQTWLPGKSLSSCLMGAMAASRDTHVNKWYVPPPLGCIPWMFFRWFHQVQVGVCYEWRQIKNRKKNYGNRLKYYSSHGSQTEESEDL